MQIQTCPVCISCVRAGSRGVKKQDRHFFCHALEEPHGAILLPEHSEQISWQQHINISAPNTITMERVV